MKRTIWIYLLPVLFLLAVTLPHLDQGDFRTDTARYAAVGLQAWRNPDLFWTPHLHPDVPYFNKPPLAFWIHGASLRLFGASLVAARLPSIIAAAGCVLFTVAIARRLLGRSTALATGIALALTYEFFRRTREISLDMWQLCFMLAALWIVVGAIRSEKQRAIWLAGIPLGLALMCKPLMALLIVPVVLLWHLGLRRRPAAGHVGIMLAVGLLVALPWHVSMWWIHGNDFVAQYLGREVLERARGDLNREPPWYYAIEMGRTYWPWLIPAVAGAYYALGRRLTPLRRTGLALAGIWLATWALALTLFPDKRPRYELPLYPALAILAGYGGVRLPWKGLRCWRRHGLPVTGAVITVAGLVAAWLPLRVQAPPDAYLTALVEWVGQSNPQRIIHSVALSSNDEGYLYLKTGHWPQPVRRDGSGLPLALPEGALLAYAVGLAPRPGRSESVVFLSGPFTVTQLGDNGPMPVQKLDPKRHSE